MKIFSATQLLIEFETWCLFWILRQVWWAEKKNLPLDLELWLQELFCFSPRKLEHLSQHHSADGYLILAEAETTRYFANFSHLLKSLSQCYHHWWWFPHLIMMQLNVPWTRFDLLTPCDATVIHIQRQQPWKLLTFQIMFSLFIIYRFPTATAAPLSYETSPTSVGGQDIFNVSCHLLLFPGQKRGRWAIFASWRWHLKRLIPQRAALFLHIYQYLKHNSMIIKRCKDLPFFQNV